MTKTITKPLDDPLMWRRIAAKAHRPGRGDRLELSEFLSASGVAVLGEIPDTTAEREIGEDLDGEAGDSE